jgi:hypothetical protein
MSVTKTIRVVAGSLSGRIKHPTAANHLLQGLNKAS